MHKLMEKRGMKKIVILLALAILTVFSTGIVFSEMRITTNDGKILKVPVNSKDIKTIEFTQNTDGLSIEGMWNSSIGFQYNITQNGNAFTWSVTKPISEQGKGTISDNNLNASWSGTNGSGNATGRITGKDSTNRATRIEWNNGVAFFR